MNTGSIIDRITEAGREVKLLHITYKSKDGAVTHRTVEPYELKDGGLYAYDVNKHGIRKFLMESITSAEVASTSFMPRYPIQF